MELKFFLTNEKICKKFKSQFDLVNYAIKLAENMIRTGRESRVRLESQNRALQVLGEIISGKDYFYEIPVKEILEVEEVAAPPSYFEKNHAEKHSSSHKSSERKKNRKILAE